MAPAFIAAPFIVAARVAAAFTIALKAQGGKARGSFVANNGLSQNGLSQMFPRPEWVRFDTEDLLPVACSAIQPHNMRSPHAKRRSSPAGGEYHSTPLSGTSKSDSTVRRINATKTVKSDRALRRRVSFLLDNQGIVRGSLVVVLFDKYHDVHLREMLDANVMRREAKELRLLHTCRRKGN